MLETTKRFRELNPQTEPQRPPQKGVSDRTKREMREGALQRILNEGREASLLDKLKLEINATIYGGGRCRNAPPTDKLAYINWCNVKHG